MRLLTFTFFFYFGRYRTCYKVYEKDFFAENEDAARILFKQQYPDANIKRVVDWEND